MTKNVTDIYREKCSECNKEFAPNTGFTWHRHENMILCFDCNAKHKKEVSEKTVTEHNLLSVHERLKQLEWHVNEHANRLSIMRELIGDIVKILRM